MTRHVVTVLVGAVLPFPALAAQQLAYEGGLSFASGTYIFNARTSSWSVATGVSLTAGRLVLRAGLPVYIQNTSLVTGSGAGMMPSGGPTSSGMVSDSGRKGMMSGGGASGRRLPVSSTALTGYRAAAGDPLVQVAWQAVRGGRTSVTIGAAAKIPASDTSAYGTGEWDAGASLSVTRQVGATRLVGLDLAYWHLGDLPQLDFRDPVVATATASQVFAGTWGVSAFVTGSSGALRGYDAPLSVGAGVSRLGGTLWGVTAAIGLTETVPDFSIAASWRIGL